MHLRHALAATAIFLPLGLNSTATTVAGQGLANKNPKPEAAPPARIVAGSPELPGPLRRQLLQRYFDAHDSEKGGLKLEQKFLDRDSTEYA
ncbi:MAG: hypothetical protein ACRES4_09870, partial [Nevskiales bacterium]